MVGTALSLILAVLQLTNSWLERQDREKLRNSGRLQQIAEASRDLQEIVERVHEVDRSILDGIDPAWNGRLRDRATGGTTDR